MKRILKITFVIVALALSRHPAVGQLVCPKGASIDTTLLELPEISRGDTIVVHDGYIVSFRPSLRQPVWVAYNLTVDEVQGETERSGSFKRDPAVEFPQAANSDYLRSGYDKGHMAPAADMKWSDKVMAESFYFTNICPQTPQLNRRNWLNLENQTRNLALRYGSVWIICGPVFDGEKKTIGENMIPVPDKFFKALLAFNGKEYVAAAFVFENNEQKQELTDVLMTVDALEASIGLDLFRHLPESSQTAAESEVKRTDWL